MNGFLAIVLVCAAAVPVPDCDEAHALDVRMTRVTNELGCALGWQEIVARSGLREDLGRDAYLKTACRRVREPG
ncbi:hypothetical protein [uncultured Methylobacterium sp.]|jgi:hypothetical protein|uniref:hypothetical protein n=1 Tax=uncultured Methylobacterium sp. TaxID=157278 RepID=UPI0026182BA8|nr:hypothetical protein [uncultured Methylobacterium sp.]